MKWNFDNASRLVAFGFGGLIADITRWPNMRWYLVIGFGWLVLIGLKKMEADIHDDLATPNSRSTKDGE